MKEELIDFINNLYAERDMYSRGKLIDLIKDKINSLPKDEALSVRENEVKGEHKLSTEEYIDSMGNVSSEQLNKKYGH